MSNEYEVQVGNRKVIGFFDGHRWQSRLYVNGGETATLVHATHKRLEGAKKWAQRVLED